jgi:hypothetical protein
MIEEGWLIELFGRDRPLWWGGIHPEIDTSLPEWVDDSLSAVRFSRKVDAEMVMAGVLGLKIPSPNVQATEHSWS